MLVLSRKPGQTIQIGPDIALTVLKITGNRIHLGLSAPKEVSIRRGEVHVRIEQERLQHHTLESNPSFSNPKPETSHPQLDVSASVV